AEWQPKAVAVSELALVQFSSGSTGTPKGVGLSHGNIAANCAAIVQTYGLDQDSKGVCWLPLHHDMGLVGHVLTTMMVGGRSTLMDPLRFLQRPLNWLRLVGQEQAMITSAPNFAYEICAKAAAGQELGDIDLSCLKVAICGGEPVLRTTAHRFITEFSRAGFAPSAFSPSYGLAEAPLLVACGRSPSGPRFVAAEGGSPDFNGGDRDETTATVADLGPPVSGVSLRIVDEGDRSVDEEIVGEIEVSGASVGRLIDEDGRLAAARPLRTGDLGFLRGGHLHVVGRQKDLIIVRGQNIHPADVEAAALEADPAIVPGGIAAIGIEVEGTQELVVLVEADGAARREPEQAKAIRRRVSEWVARRVGHVPAEVVVLRLGALPRTSSGKVRRFEAAELLRSGALAGQDQRSPASEIA
ncbi:MAG: AMP-binding protein, partial [Bauldia sp.]